MATILLHSSKTMRRPENASMHTTSPALQTKTRQLAQYLSTLTPEQLQTTMHVSQKLASEVHDLYAQWESATTMPAIDAFIGDIYSGLRAAEFSPAERSYAHEHLLILSGLYGGLRALDAVAPYRLEMGYKLPDEPYRNLYSYWAADIANLVRSGEPVINLSAVEYTKALLPHLASDTRIITPRFLTISPKTGQPTFVTVHAKIARGAFAHWLIQTQYQDGETLTGFDELGYRHNKALSSATEPVFVCQEFGGLGLSVRLS